MPNHHLVVRYNNATHSFVATPSVDVEGVGAAVTARRDLDGPGEYHFDLNGAQQFEVTIDFHTSEDGRLLVRDTFSIAGGALGWVASAAVRRERDEPPPSRLGRRATIRTVGTEHYLDVDVSFLDATHLVQVNDPRQPWLPDLRVHDCELRVYQYTGTEGEARATCVGVVVPKPFADHPERGSADVLVFFGPSGSTYTNAHDVTARSFERYVYDSHLAPGGEDFWGFVQHPRGHHVRFETHPRCRFARQLRASGRAVVYVMPIPDGSHLEPWNREVLTQSPRDDTPPLLDRLLLALQADGLVGRTHPQRVARGRVGIAGYSFGGRPALSAFEHNERRVVDLYLLDPEGFTVPYRERVENWAKTRDHRLRIVGGIDAHTLREYARDVINAIARGTGDRAIDGSHDRRPADPMPDGASVMVLPTSDQFWRRSKDYRQAFASPEGPVLGAYGEPSWLGTHLHLFVGAPNPPPVGQEVTLEVRDPNGALLGSVPARNGASAEELGFWFYSDSRFRDPRVPLRDRAELEGKVSAIFHFTRADSQRGSIPFPQWVRHQWAAAGGQSAGDVYDRTSFKGYLQICLETGSLGK